MLYDSGISISYNKVPEISAQLRDAVATQYAGVVCPPVLQKELFATAARDNTDHSPTASVAQTSFFGTSIFDFQSPSSQNSGQVIAQLQSQEAKMKTVPELPDSHTVLVFHWITSPKKVQTSHHQITKSVFVKL